MRQLTETQLNSFENADRDVPTGVHRERDEST